MEGDIKLFNISPADIYTGFCKIFSNRSRLGYYFNNLLLSWRDIFVFDYEFKRSIIHPSAQAQITQD